MSRKNLNGVHIPHRKNTAGMQAIKMPPPATVTIPMSMHIGKPANCIVAVGDHVNVGQMIGEPGGFVSSPVFASVSGTVKKIDMDNETVTVSVSAFFGKETSVELELDQVELEK